jgi:hypothetical protein
MLLSFRVAPAQLHLGWEWGVPSPFSQLDFARSERRACAIARRCLRGCHPRCPSHKPTRMAEAELNKLRRLAENRRCGTCCHEDRLGFNAVCVKFQIFVCGDCKSAHQAFSHRCKVRAGGWAIAKRAQPRLAGWHFYGGRGSSGPGGWIRPKTCPGAPLSRHLDLSAARRTVPTAPPPSRATVGMSNCGSAS